ncbi:hypothetical protein N657DRAFT_338298 [Parathielavia appendiculata]|uniref:Uncharacterized protein n=1 Tax=Parathielavia appendiculata TaxID=2587402 RepID=A0AAN6U1V7_9PEZI|nr:hypothetical protein N657DRAFT_338298 [Parathielavia appendiculata]
MKGSLCFLLWSSETEQVQALHLAAHRPGIIMIWHRFRTLLCSKLILSLTYVTHVLFLPFFFFRSRCSFPAFSSSPPCRQPCLSLL